mgnify:CR=1 FL=1
MLSSPLSNKDSWAQAEQTALESQARISRDRERERNRDRDRERDSKLENHENNEKYEKHEKHENKRDVAPKASVSESSFHYSQSKSLAEEEGAFSFIFDMQVSLFVRFRAMAVSLYWYLVSCRVEH